MGDVLFSSYSDDLRRELLKLAMGNLEPGGDPQIALAAAQILTAAATQDVADSLEHRRRFP